MKQRKLNKRKGFTLVELLVVIAILAVLATVSVVGYTSFTKKAKVSNDKSLVSQLNLALDADETLNGKAATPTDALKATREAGYVVEKLTPTTSKYNIVWNQEKNEFALLDEDNKTVFGEVSKDTYKNWKFVDTYVEEGYSLYLNSGFTGTLPATIKTGLDVGENEGLNVSYTKDTTAKNDVVIRTNGGELTVNADTDTVYHYGSSSKVTITAVAGNSYHENGTVTGNLEVLKGRVELGKAADVNTVLVKSATANDVKVDVVSGAKVGSVAPTTEAAKSDINASTTIPTDSKVTEVVDTTKTEMFAGGLGTEKSPYLVANEEQLYKVSDFSDSVNYFKQIENIEIHKSVDYLNGFYDGNNNKITYNVSDASCGIIFDSSKGYIEIKNLTIVMGKVGVSLLRLADWGTSYGATFENITFNSTVNLSTVNATNFGFVLINPIYTGGESNPVYTFKNITNNVNLQNEGTCTGFLVGSGPCFNVKTTVNYDNCINNGSIAGTSSVGFLYGNSAYIESVEETNSIITVNNCKNNNVFSSSKDDATVAFAPKLDEINSKYQSNVGGTFLANNYFKGKDITINQTGNTFTINTIDTNVSYKLAFTVSATYWKQDGTAWTEEDVKLISEGPDSYDKVWNISNGIKYMIDLPVNTNETGTLNKTIKAYDKVTAENNGIIVNAFTNGFAIVEQEGTTYLVVDTSIETYINSNVSLSVYAYDTNGTVLGILNVK